MGSKPLLVDIVKQGIASFKFEVLEVFYTDVDIDLIEDQYIEKYEALAPRGYNLRMNRLIEANGEEINLNNIEIQAKFVFKTETHKVFTVGEFSQCRSFQKLINIKHHTETTCIKQKKMFKFRYLELQIESNDDYVEGGVYKLNLKYKFTDDAFATL